MKRDQELFQVLRTKPKEEIKQFFLNKEGFGDKEKIIFYIVFFKWR